MGNNCCVQKREEDLKDGELEKGKSLGIVDHDRSKKEHAQVNKIPRGIQKSSRNDDGQKLLTPTPRDMNKKNEEEEHKRQGSMERSLNTKSTNIEESKNPVPVSKQDSNQRTSSISPYKDSDQPTSSPYDEFNLSAIEREAANGKIEKQQSDENNLFGKVTAKELLAQSGLPRGSYNDKSLISATDEHQYLNSMAQTNEQINPDEYQFLQNRREIQERQTPEVNVNFDYSSPAHARRLSLNSASQSPELKEQMEQVDESQVIDEFFRLYNSDAELKQMLGDQPDVYPLDEKWSIVQAYKKGGGVAGLNDIIDHGDDVENDDFNIREGDDFDDDFNDRIDAPQEEDQVEIDLNSPEDVQIIEEEFRKLYDQLEDLRNQYGDALLQLEVVEKYQVIDAYHRGGVEAIQQLLDVE